MCKGTTSKESVTDRSKDVKRIYVVRVPHTSVHALPSRNSEWVTEVLLGDEIRVLKEKRSWIYSSIPIQMGYRGWLKKRDLISLKEDAPFHNTGFMPHIRAPHTTLTLNPELPVLPERDYPSLTRMINFTRLFSLMGDTGG